MEIPATWDTRTVMQMRDSEVGAFLTSHSHVIASASPTRSCDFVSKKHLSLKLNYAIVRPTVGRREKVRFFVK